MLSAVRLPVRVRSQRASASSEGAELENTMAVPSASGPDRSEAAASAGPGALIRAARAGDHGAFERLVHGQSQRLFRIAWRVVGDAFLAEDVVQETLLRVLTGSSTRVGLRLPMRG